MVVTAVKKSTVMFFLGSEPCSSFLRHRRVACVIRPRGSCTRYSISVCLIKQTKGMAARGRGLFNLLCQGWSPKRAV